MFEYIFFNPYIMFLIGAIILFYSSELLINNAILISEHLNISKLIVGGTIIAFGTSFPEIIVSILANIRGNGDIVIGNIVGSNVTNIGLVLGISLCYKIIYIDNHDKKNIYNILSMLLFTVIFYLLLLFGKISGLSGFILISSYFIYFTIMIKYFTFDYKEQSLGKLNVKVILNIIAGIVLIYYGSHLFLDGAIGISMKLGIHDLALGMTIVALGTSAPEIVTSFSALRKNEDSLVIGNIIGSNIANIVFAGGISSMIGDIYINYNNIFYYNNLMIFITIIFTLVLIFSKNIYKIYSLLFISIYFIFIYLNFCTN